VKSRIPFYPIAGGQDVDAVLKSISDELAQLRVKKEAGEDVTDDLKRVEDELAQVKAAQAAAQTKETNTSSEDDLQKRISDALTGVFANATAATQEDAATKAARELLESQKASAQAAAQVAAQQAANVPANLLSQDAVKGLIDQITEGVKMQLSGIIPASQMQLPGENAEEQALLKYANEHGWKVVDPSGLRVGADREVKAFLTSKEPQFAKTISMMWRHKLGFMTDFDRKALAELTDSAGGFLVPQQWMDDILGLIRARATVRAAGPRIVPFGKKMFQTSIATGATAFYIDENNPIPVSEPSFAEVPLLAPKILTGLVPVSNDLLDDAPEAEAVVREDLAEVVALREDLAFLEGTGSSSQPRGFKNIVGISDLTASNVSGTGAGGAINANADFFSSDMVRRMIAFLRTQNVRGARLAFFFHPHVLTALEMEKDTQGRYLLDTNVLVENEDQTSGTIWGVPYYTTTQIPTNLTRGTYNTATYVLLVNMAEAVVGINKELVIDMSSEAAYKTNVADPTTIQSAYQNRQTLFRAQLKHDINHRRPNQILLLQGIKTV